MVSVSGSGRKSHLDEAGKIWEDGWWGRRERQGGLGDISIRSQSGRELELSVVLTGIPQPGLPLVAISTAGRGVGRDLEGARGRRAHLSRALALLLQPGPSGHRGGRDAKGQHCC